MSFFTDQAGQPVLASSDPASQDALFFIQVSSKQNIENIDGTGIVQPLSTVDVHWLIIPGPGASNDSAAGTLYSVGAKLTYTMSGKVYTLETTPDQINVKPVPRITLDYFLPYDVYGDDAFTPDIEPSVPFTFGLRASNNRQGTVRNLQISTAQPKIIDNAQGLIASYVIQNCDVNGSTAAPSLTVDLGNIDASQSSTARWIMTCSLSGRFTDFKAEYSHSDESLCANESERFSPQ